MMNSESRGTQPGDCISSGSEEEIAVVEKRLTAENAVSETTRKTLKKVENLQGESSGTVRVVQGGRDILAVSSVREEENEMNNGKAGISFEKLKGRSNFDEWKISAKSYLIIKGLWSVVSDESDDEDKNDRAVGEITLMVEPTLYSYIPTAYDNAKEVWDKLAATFEDKGVARKVTILNTLVSFKLINFGNNMERYINEILLYWEKSKLAGFKIEEAVIASLMLGGLAEEYRAMILGIENSGKELTIDYVKTILLQGIPENGLMGNKEDNSERALAAACRKGAARRRRCFICESELHLAVSCPKRETKCYVCGKESHKARQCPDRHNKKEEDTEDKKDEKERVL